jgi:hypothetical protein
MKALFWIIAVFYSALFFIGYSSQPEVKLLQVSSNVTIQESIGVKDQKGNKVGSIISSVLEYQFILDIPNLDTRRKIPYKFSIEPSKELLAVLPKGKNDASQPQTNNPFIQNEDLVGVGMEGLRPEPNSRYRCHLDYEFGRRGTGSEASRLEDSPFPNADEVKDIKGLALHSILTVSKDGKVMKRIDLRKFLNDK